MLILPRSTRRLTLAADKRYDVRSFIETLRQTVVTPHITRNVSVTKTSKRRRSAMEGRTTRHIGYTVSQRVRKRIEEPFGWAKVNAGLSKTEFRGRARVEHRFTLAMAACNLIRLPRLPGASP